MTTIGFQTDKPIVSIMEAVAWMKIVEIIRKQAVRLMHVQLNILLSGHWFSFPSSAIQFSNTLPNTFKQSLLPLNLI